MSRLPQSPKRQSQARPAKCNTPPRRMTPNPSLKAPTRYGSHRPAAPGQGCYRPSAASRRLPPRSA